MAAKLLWSVVGLALTLIAIWQAVDAGWMRPASPSPAPAAAGQAAFTSPDPLRLRPDSVIAEGRLATYPGAEVVIATELPGIIVRLLVQEKSIVRKGDLIAELSSDELVAAR